MVKDDLNLVTDEIRLKS